MKILLTGSSGFLGGIIKDSLINEEIITLGRSDNDSIIADICDVIPALPKVDLIIHSAGKAHSVPKTEEEKKEFFNVNVAGTKNLLNRISCDFLPDYFVLISTVAVYGKECGLEINEETMLNAKDPYGISKIETEKIVTEWCKLNNVTCTILRLPLVAGPNPPGNLKSMVEGIKKGYYFDIGGGTAHKSIVLAEDVAKIIPTTAKIGGIYNLTDGHHPSFSELSSHIARQFGKSTPLNLPKFIAYIAAFAGDFIGSKALINSKKLRKITSDLTFDDSKARERLGWNPTGVLDGFILKNVKDLHKG